MWLIIIFILGFIFVPYLAWYFFIVNSGNVNVPGGESIRDFLSQSSEKRDAVLRLGGIIVLWTSAIYIAMWAIGYYVKDENKWYLWAVTQILFVIVWNRLTKKATQNQVYVIGGSKSEFQAIREGLIKQGGKTLVDVSHISPILENVPFFRHTTNAIICTSDGIEKLTPNSIKFLRSVAEKSTCRIYLNGIIPDGKRNLFEDFIQRANYNEDNFFEEVVNFLKAANSYTQKENLLGARDIFCLGAYKILKWFWTISYVVALFHLVNSAYQYFKDNTPPWNTMLVDEYFITIVTFFGLFFCIHAVITIARNTILAFTKIKTKRLEFFIGVLIYCLIVGIVLFSVIDLDKSLLRIYLSAASAIFAYWLYMYSLRIRAECTSLTEIYSLNFNSKKRQDLINMIGRSPFPTGAFPIIAKNSGSIFISNMHKSKWSKESAEELKKRLSGKYDVFLDHLSINPGDLWRRHILRNISECTFFIAFLDDKYLDSEWVLTESIYSALLRKNVAKPRILLVFQTPESKYIIENSSYGDLYKDIFKIPENLQIGAGLLITFTDDKDVTVEKTIKSLDKIKPMQLL